jgi:hypothetical protein
VIAHPDKRKTVDMIKVIILNLLFMANSVLMVVAVLSLHPPLNPLPSREGKLMNFPLPFWERVKVRGTNLNNF